MASTAVSSSTTRYKVCLFRIHHSRRDILDENGLAIQVKWERDMSRLSGNTNSSSNPSSSNIGIPPPRPASDFSSLAASLRSTDTPSASQDIDNVAGPSSTSFDHQVDQDDACVIELTDYETFWRGRLTRKDWESQRHPAFEASVYEKWTRAAFSGDKIVDGYRVALTARRSAGGMVLTWTVSKQEGTGEKRNLLGSITLAPSVDDNRRLWADWTLNAIHERDRFQLQLSSLQKRADNLEQLAMTSHAMLVTMQQERTDDRSDLLEKVRALINSKKVKIKSLVNRNKLLESELADLKTQMTSQIKAEVDAESKPDKGKRRAKTPAPKGIADKTPAQSQESLLASDPGFVSTIPRTQRTTTGKGTRLTNPTAMPSPESDPVFCDLVPPDMAPGASQDPPSDPISTSFPSSSSYAPSVVSTGSHPGSSSRLSLMDRVSQAASQPRQRPEAQLEISKDMDQYFGPEDDSFPLMTHERPDHKIKDEDGLPQPAKAYMAVGESLAASVQAVDPSSYTVEKYRRGVVKQPMLANVKQEPILQAPSAILQAYSDKDGSTRSRSDDHWSSKAGQTLTTSNTSKSTTSRTSATSSSILSSTRRLPAIGKKMLTTGGNTSTRMRALEKHKAAQQLAQEGSGSDQQGDTTTSSFSVSSISLANRSGAYSPDSSMDHSRLIVTSAPASPNAAGGSGSDNQRGAGGVSVLTSGTKRGSGARTPQSPAGGVKRTRQQHAAMQDSLLLPDTDELFKRLQ